MIDKAKEYVNENKKNIIIGVVLLIISVIAWDVFSPTVSDQRGTTDTVREQLKSTGNELERAGQAVTESQRITSEIRQTNTTIIREINTSRELNQSDSKLIESSKSILRDVRQGKQSGN
jgi:predicted negative regulator of RcsB-dependent stress response